MPDAIHWGIGAKYGPARGPKRVMLPPQRQSLQQNESHPKGKAAVDKQI